MENIILDYHPDWYKAKEQFFFSICKTDKKKKMTFKKADGKKDVHHNSSITGSSKVQPAEMVDMAAVNPDPDGITSPVGSPAVTVPGTGVYPGNIVIPPPPRSTAIQQVPSQHLQQRGNWPQQSQQQMPAVYMVPAQQAHFITTPFQSPGPPPQQMSGQFVTQSYQQGHYAGAQYHQTIPVGPPVQGVVYSGQVIAGSHHGNVLARTQSLPVSTGKLHILSVFFPSYHCSKL